MIEEFMILGENEKRPKKIEEVKRKKGERKNG